MAQCSTRRHRGEEIQWRGSLSGLGRRRVVGSTHRWAHVMPMAPAIFVLDVGDVLVAMNGDVVRVSDRADAGVGVEELERRPRFECGSA